MEISFAGVDLELPDGWYDITADVGPAAPPTLAREHGAGVLQFSLGHHRSGPLPDFTGAVLLGMLQEFARSKEVVLLGDGADWNGRTRCVYGDVRDDHDAVRIYYVSDGPNIAMMTYRRAESESDARELDEADHIVRSMTFPGRA